MRGRDLYQAVWISGQNTGDAHCVNVPTPISLIPTTAYGTGMLTQAAIKFNYRFAKTRCLGSFRIRIEPGPFLIEAEQRIRRSIEVANGYQDRCEEASGILLRCLLGS